MCLYPSGWEAWGEWEASFFPWLCAFNAKVENKKEVEFTYRKGSKVLGIRELGLRQGQDGAGDMFLYSTTGCGVMETVQWGCRSQTWRLCFFPLHHHHCDSYCGANTAPHRAPFTSERPGVRVQIQHPRVPNIINQVIRPLKL